jgi:hypothetical protein
MAHPSGMVEAGYGPATKSAEFARFIALMREKLGAAEVS